MLDDLTGLYNEEYLKQNYDNYIKNHPSSRFIMVDFTKFKKINDSYGHSVGDKCLISFASKLKLYFDWNDSILARIHGDEFVIVTDFSNEKIVDIINKMQEGIISDASLDIIPVKFSFNSGIVNALNNFDTTFDMADCMMYYAKKNSLSMQFFDDEIFQDRLAQEEFIEKFDKRLTNDGNPNFSYYCRNLYDNNSTKTRNIQIYTKNIDGSSIVNGASYEQLRSGFTIAKFDYTNLKYLVNKLSAINDDNNYMISVDYKSLFSFDKLIPYLNYVKYNSLKGLSNIVLSVDLSGIEPYEYTMTLSRIGYFKSLGLSIKLDKVDDRLPYSLIDSVNPDYIKISTSSWRKAMENDRKKKILKSELDLLKAYNNDLRLVFDQIEKQEESEFLKVISCDDSLFLGKYYSKERKLTLK